MGEIGGEFHWHGSFPGPTLAWSAPQLFLNTGRTALLLIWQQMGSVKLWLPTFFCEHTSHYWKTCGVQIMRYRDNPARSHPDWATLCPEPGDMVMAMNYFGGRSAEPWQTWHTENPQVVMIEDHTHDPFSTWARSSRADYAFASLRKTLPIPEGGVLWSPAGHPLPPEPDAQDWSGSGLMLAAMMWKSDYLNQGETDASLKKTFLQYQHAAHEALGDLPPQKLSPWSRTLLEAGVPVSWRQQREANVQYLLKNLPASDYAKPLFTAWGQGNCPFNLILLTDTPARRDALRRHFISADIYPPVHWMLTEGSDSQAVNIANRIMTIPVDQRYTQADGDRIIKVLCEFLESQSPV